MSGRNRGEKMVGRFLHRLANGEPFVRIEVVRTLARLYLDVPLDPDDRRAVCLALTAILDDPVPRVRRALAQALADSPAAPRNVILILAEDQADIAEIVLERSPVLSEPELIDIAAGAQERQRTAIARRDRVDVGLAAALVEVSGAGTCLALLSNPGAKLAASSFRRLAERHSSDAELRTALLDRPDLPLDLRQSLIDGLADALGELIRLHNWLAPERAERVLREAREVAAVELSRNRAPMTLRAFVDKLMIQKRLTPELVIRAACSGNLGFFEVAMSVLAGMPERRTIALLYDRRAFAAFYRRTGLPKDAFPAFMALVETLHESEGRLPLSLMMARVVARGRGLRVGGDEYLGLIGRLGAEAARREARAEAGGYFRAA